jgi:sulfoxide reductase heme-binding subunit YedZ
MSEAVGTRRAARPAPRRSFWPWDDKAGRFSPLKATALVLQIAPAAYLIWNWSAGMLGPRPVTEVIHGTGLWAIRFLVLSLLISPARAIFPWPRIMLIRRQLGLTALFYAVAHLVLYALDQKWALLHVASEIVLRFYLTIGFVALLGLTALGVTSTDGMIRRMGRRWKQLHRLAYPVALLGVFHFFLQSKADVSEATIMAGVYLWLMGWRLLPAGADRAPLPIFALGVAATLATAGLEYVWFALATKVPPLRPLLAELDWSFGPHAAGQMLILGGCMTIATALAWAGQRETLRKNLAYRPALYAGGATIVCAIAYAFSLTDFVLPESWTS